MLCALAVALNGTFSPRAVALLDTAHLPAFTCAPGSAGGGCTAEVRLAPRAATLRVYDSASPAAPYALVASAPLPAASPACAPAPGAAAAPVGPAVGLLYEGWQAFAANASRAVRAAGGAFTSVEDVLRSNGAQALSDMWEKYGVAGETGGFDWQARPALGPYCIYRARPGEAGVIPDCEGIPATIGQQAAWFAAAGVDFITSDGTNLCTPSPFADAIQTRPMEVLFEEFAALRARNLSTPAIAAWHRLAPGCTLQAQVLAVYNDPAHAPLVLRDGATGKKVFFTPAEPDPALVAAVEANGGRNDVLVQEMWALFAPEAYAQGRWAFMSPCTTPGNASGGGGGRMTTNVVGNGRGATPCGQQRTTGSALGSATAISPSYQLSYGSVPFSAAGKFGGLTLKRQFATVFAAAAGAWAGGGGGGAPPASGLPDNLYLSSWNEWLSQPQKNPFSGHYAQSMGLPADPARSALYVDTYGGALSRDLEPSAQDGSALFDLLTSCLRVVKVMAAAGARAAGGAPPTARAALAAAFADPSPAACAVAGEACCAFNATEEDYASVWSLQRSDGRDALVTAAQGERDALVAGGGWAEVCNCYGGPTDFCVDASLLSSPKAMQGPFVLHAGCGSGGGGGGARRPLSRCRAADGRHFLVGSAADCGEGGATLETLVGCMAPSPSSNTPRGLRVCVEAATGRRFHFLDATACPAGSADAGGGVLGYVH